MISYTPHLVLWFFNHLTKVTYFLSMFVNSIKSKTAGLLTVDNFCLVVFPVNDLHKKSLPSGWLVTSIFTQRIMKTPFIFHWGLGFFQTFGPWTNTVVQSWHLSLTNAASTTVAPCLCLSAQRAVWQTWLLLFFFFLLWLLLLKQQS